MIEHGRLQVDARKWILAKALPKIYVDKVTAELTGKDGGPIEASFTVTELARRVAFIFTAGMQEEEEAQKDRTGHQTIPIRSGQGNGVPHANES